MKSEGRNPKSEGHPNPDGRIGGRGLGFRLSSFGFFRGCLVWGAWLWAGTAGAADQLGDVSVSADAIYTGNTYHGYAEMRVVLENHSPAKTHLVTLVYPNQAYPNSGNNVSRLARGVSVPPDSREVISLLEPPLPAPGDGSIRVEVDGRREGAVRAPNANNHCNNSWRGGVMMANVFVSRSLDFDAVSHLFQAGVVAFTAAKATGPPDAAGSGYQPNCWMPDTRRRAGTTNWLELDYAAPQLADRVMVYETQSPLRDGSVALLGAGGANLASLSLAAGKVTSISAGWVQEYNFTTTTQSVKTVRFTYGSRTPAYNISVDAVEISGPSGSQWAADARASSDNSVSGMRFRAGSATPDEVQCLRAESPVSEWSDTWLAYSPFEVVVVNQGDVAAMTPAVRAALDDYSQAGGNLVMLGAGDLPAPWRAAQTRKTRDGLEGETGFGRVFVFNSENPAALDAASLQRLRDAVRESVRYIQSLPGDSGAANSVMPVVENLKIPARGTVIIMLAFVIVIGPVNLIYLNRIKRRTWMLWTIPAISLATTLVVFAYSLLREGVTPDTRIAGVTVLDQTSHRAATIGGEAFYCPLTPSGGLHFDFATEATPLVSLGYGSGTPREVDWTQSQHFEHGWVSARVPAHFHLRKPETRRERIQIVDEAGKLQVVNSLGAPIKTLWFADADTNVFQADNVPAGEKGGLLRSPQPVSSEGSGPDGLLREAGFAAHLDSLAGHVGRFLVPNSYVAVLAGNPFLENALGSAASPRRTKSVCVVYGFLDAAEVAGGAR